ncbi:hypothetical protein ACFQZZ_31855 [Nocardia sp. GCM10030253]|uniref:hypothetical protein n=1 Tax=Nocardia sp. GCM10030253 TaxID=3273404 RepID=UPI003624F6DA
MSSRRFVARVKEADWYRLLVRRSQGPLPPERATARLSAYVYGNILALASVAIATTATIGDGTAAALVAGTGATTFVAHVFAELVAHTSVAESPTPTLRTASEAAAGLRDAVPIASSAGIPSALLCLGWFGVLSAQWAQLLAGSVIVVRLATVPIITTRIRGNSAGPRVLVAGLILAAIAALIVGAKVALGH